MQQKKSMTVLSRRNSFKYAFSGLRLIFNEEPNVKLHAVATVAAIAAGIIKHISPGQWIAIVIAIAMVWITEALNTCIERLCDLYTTEYRPEIKIIKDIAAAAVLVAAIASVVIAVIVFFF